MEREPLTDADGRRLLAEIGSGAMARWRAGLAVLIGALASAYFVAIVVGGLPSEQRIDSNGLILIVLVGLSIVLLTSPRLLQRLTLLELPGFKLQLDRLIRAQEDQERRLAIISSLLPLLLPAPEQQHMLNLDYGRTMNYTGGSNLRAELRRLRSIKIIEMVSDKVKIADLHSNSTYDIADYIRLTPLGKDWVEVIKELEEKGPAMMQPLDN